MSANLAQIEPWAPLSRQTDGALAPGVASRLTRCQRRCQSCFARA